MEEWEGEVLYDWNQTHWATINDTSQPYYPSESDILVTGDPSIPVLEVPDNGILVDYVSGDEMIEIFDANWPGGALTVPKVYSIGYHGTGFSVMERQTMDKPLDHAERFLISHDRGPVLYGTLSEMPLVWKRE